MDFDDQLIAQLNAPEHRTPTPPPPPQDATTTSTPPTNPTTTPSLPRPTMTAKDGESYYIKPIPSGLRAPSLSSLMQLCHTHTLHHGFDVVKKAGVKPTSSKNGKKTIVPNAAYYKWHITCVLGGKPKNTRHLTEEQRRRDKGSLKMGCPSRVWAWAVERGEPDGAWEIRWGDTDPALHNHPPVDVRTLPNHRRRAREVDGVAEAIKEIAASGVGRKEGLQKLRSLYPDGLFSEKDVANELQKYKLQLKQQKAAEEEEQGGGGEGDEGQEEDMEDVDEAELQLQQQLQAQTQRDHQHQLQQLQQQQPQMQQPSMQHQPQMQHQTQHQHQQHQHIFTPGVPGYW
ncbi:hypothetical protein D6C95_06875 [Aureobasidium pullulans]|nr:hypothetical protein D6C95_06875 [Aureobasidium pullulans]